MDQKKLREWDKRCIQGEPPACTARCPLHVDARLFLRNVAQGKWNDAVNVLAATMPLPGIVGRICDHPCESVCRRAEAGDSIAISDLEKTALAIGRVTKRLSPAPLKDPAAAVIGSGLTCLTAAWDLAYKGYKISIFHREGWKPLRDISKEILPTEIVDREIEFLAELGVTMRPVPHVMNRDFLESLLTQFDAVFISLDSEILTFVAIAEAHVSIDPLTLATSRPGLFVVGRPTGDNFFSPIESVVNGRKAAQSIDRFLQGVSLPAGREKEGPYETKLFTSINKIDARSRIPMEDPAGFNETEAKEEAKRCIQCECMECKKVCLYIEGKVEAQCLGIEKYSDPPTNIERKGV